MNNRLLLLLPLWLSVSLAAGAATGQVLFRTGDLNTLKAESVRQGKPLFVHFTAKWCMPCQWMDQHTFTDPQLADLVNRYFIPVKVDIDERSGLLAKKEYRVVLLPSMLVFDQRGLVVGRYEESMAASRLYQLLGRHYEEQTGQVIVTAPAAAPVLEAPRPASSTVSRPALQPEPATARPASPAPGRSPATASRPAAPSPAPSAPVTPSPVTPSPATAPRPAAPSPAPSAPAATPPRPSFGVQVGVFSSYENAVRQMEDLERRFDKPVNVFVTEQNGRQLYRILIGVFDNRDDAAAYVRELERQSVSGFVKDLSEL